jgi:hypothetical protein
MRLAGFISEEEMRDSAFGPFVVLLACVISISRSDGCEPHGTLTTRGVETWFGSGAGVHWTLDLTGSNAIRSYGVDVTDDMETITEATLMDDGTIHIEAVVMDRTNDSPAGTS